MENVEVLLFIFPVRRSPQWRLWCSFIEIHSLLFLFINFFLHVQIGRIVLSKTVFDICPEFYIVILAAALLHEVVSCILESAHFQQHLYSRTC